MMNCVLSQLPFSCPGGKGWERQRDGKRGKGTLEGGRRKGRANRVVFKVERGEAEMLAYLAEGCNMRCVFLRHQEE